MIIIDILILIIIISIIYINRNNILNAIKLIGSLTIISGYLIIIIPSILNRRININVISKIIKNNLINKGLILMLLGGIEIVVYVMIKIYNGRFKNEYRKRRIIKQ